MNPPAPLPPLPARPLQLTFPGRTGLRSRLGAVTLFVLFVGLGVFIAWISVPGIVQDFAIRDTARPVGNAYVSGSCNTYNGVFTTCDADLRHGSVTTHQNLGFLSLHSGDFSVAVEADPSNPTYLTTDLAIDNLYNRIISVGALTGLMLVLGIGAPVGLWRTANRQRQLAAYSGQQLEPVALQVSRKTVAGRTRLRKFNYRLEQAGQKTLAWIQPAKNPLFTLDPAGKTVLGVRPRGSNDQACPLDAKLSFLNLSDNERQAIGTPRQATA